MYPEAIESLIELFRKLPSVGRKTAERYAMKVLDMSEQEAKTFSDQIIAVKNKVTKCPECGNLSENGKCSVCADKTRDRTTICVVEGAKDVLAIEKAGQYHGVYHVLNGVINPAKGDLPENVEMLEPLFKRINKDVAEVILATSATIEGETTALYLIRRFKKYPWVKVSRIAVGLPIGGQVEYADEITLTKAMAGRVTQQESQKGAH